jgi:hypothetical protein
MQFNLNLWKFGSRIISKFNGWASKRNEIPKLRDK